MKLKVYFNVKKKTNLKSMQMRGLQKRSWKLMDGFQRSVKNPCFVPELEYTQVEIIPKGRLSDSHFSLVQHTETL